MATYAKLLNGLTDLGIHKMQEHLDYYIDLVNKGQKSFSDALEELIDIEKKNNQLRAENACVKTANFPFIKTLDDFEFDFQPGINRKEMLESGNLGFIDRKENILFVGSSGVGKTHLATAIGIACARARYSTYFISFESLMTQLKKALLENRLEARMKFFAKYKVLIIDEIGYMPIDTDSANLFFQLIAKRYEKHCTLITTNMPFSKWGEIFGSPTLANAVLDRLLHHSQVISIKGPSYRLKEKRAFMETQAHSSWKMYIFIFHFLSIFILTFTTTLIYSSIVWKSQLGKLRYLLLNHYPIVLLFFPFFGLISKKSVSR